MTDIEEDSVLIDEEKNTKSISAISFKPLIVLFMLFLLITSDVFISNIVGKMGGTGSLFNPTVFGSIIQGVFLVLFYVVALYMMEHDLI